MNRGWLAALCLALLSSAACRSGLPRQEFAFAGLEREYYLIEPPAKPRAIVFALHGGSGTALHMLKLVPDLKDLAVKHSALVVLPQGEGKSWNDGRTDPISVAHKQKLPDSEFLTSLAEKLKAERNIPDGQIFTMGISNGGMMSLRLVCDSVIFSAAVIVAAQMQIDYADKCRASQKPRVLFVVGVNDPLVPYDGGPVSVLGRKRGVVYSADRSAQYWVGKNGCMIPRTDKQLPDVSQDQMSSRMQTWDCAEGRVGIVHVTGGGHTWPGGQQYLPAAFVGPTTMDFSAAQMAFQWFGLEQ